MIRISIEAYWTQKLGNSAEEYEDAFWFNCNPDGCKIALSDGVTEGSFSDKWAQMLTKEFVANPPSHFLRQQEFVAWSKKLGKKWYREVKVIPDLPWWTMDSISEGTGATFLGVSVEPSGWLQAISLGDAVLFIINPEKGHFFSWPMKHSEDFGDEPYLMRTKVSRSVQKGFKTLKGIKITSEDLIIAATDALAASIFKMREESIPLMDLIETLNFQSKAGFELHCRNAATKKNSQ